MSWSERKKNKRDTKTQNSEARENWSFKSGSTKDITVIFKEKTQVRKETSWMIIESSKMPNGSYTVPRTATVQCISIKRRTKRGDRRNFNWGTQELQDGVRGYWPLWRGIWTKSHSRVSWPRNEDKMISPNGGDTGTPQKEKDGIRI